MRRGNNWILIILVVLLVIFGIYMIWGNGNNTRDSYTPGVQSETNSKSPEDDMEIISTEEPNDEEDIEIINPEEEMDEEPMFY